MFIINQSQINRFISEMKTAETLKKKQDFKNVSPSALTVSYKTQKNA